LELGHRNAILLTGDVDTATGGLWGLGSFASYDGLRVMAGWTIASEEGGVPPVVARTFARAMTRYGRVTFPCSTIDTHSEDKQGVDARWCQVRAKGDDNAFFAQAGERRSRLSLGRLGNRKTSGVSLLSTLQEETVSELLFEDPYYQWWNASQFALMSRRTDTLPIAAWRFVGELFEEAWADVAAAAEAKGMMEAVMRSGVDGDICGLVFANAEVRRTFEALLQGAAAEHGLVLRTVSFAEFGQLLSEALGGTAPE
jgi:hypothetical protein